MRKKLLIRNVSCLLGLVFLLLGGLMSPTARTSPPPAGREDKKETSAPEPAKAPQGPISKYQLALQAVLIGLGTSLEAVAVVGLIETKVRERDEKIFEDFFGAGSLLSNEPGHVILQADRIDDLMIAMLTPKVPLPPATVASIAPLAAEVQKKIDSPADNRLFKARTWVNARDTEAAKVIREELRRVDLPAPELFIDDHNNPNTHEHEAAPYIISMGLAFAKKTGELIGEIGGADRWIYIEPSSTMGDAIVVNRRIIKGGYAQLKLEPVARSEYVQIFPGGWDPSVWLDPKAPPSNDYAIILRHRERQGSHWQTLFVLAGFTEDGTTAAARYFAAHWPWLWENYVKGTGNSGGNFLVLISGDCRSKTAWPQEPVFAITKKELTGFKCPWTGLA